MPFNIPPQNYFFYPSKWNAEMDAFFLNTIITLFKDGNWKATRISAHAIHLARGSLNEHFSCSLSWNDVYERFKMFETRFQTFKEVIDVPETYWDLRMNCIIAIDEVWKRIFKKNEFAKAYYHNGEPAFEKLALLFGLDDIKVEVSKTIVIISDTTLPIESRNKPIVDVSDDEEVTSPLPNQSGKTRRRLFDDEPQTTDMESTNNKGPYYIDVGPDGDQKFPLRNSFPPRPIFDHDAMPSKGPSGSYCASSSPSKWWKNPFN